jgi:hypothetical protein
MPYAIMQKSYPYKWVRGTDYRYDPPHQILSDDTPLMFMREEDAEAEFRKRRIGKGYRIVKVKVVSVDNK